MDFFSHHLKGTTGGQAEVFQVLTLNLRDHQIRVYKTETPAPPQASAPFLTRLGLFVEASMTRAPLSRISSVCSAHPAEGTRLGSGYPLRFWTWGASPVCKSRAQIESANGGVVPGPCEFPRWLRPAGSSSPHLPPVETLQT